MASETNIPELLRTIPPDKLEANVRSARDRWKKDAVEEVRQEVVGPKFTLWCERRPAGRASHRAYCETHKMFSKATPDAFERQMGRLFNQRYDPGPKSESLTDQEIADCGECVGADSTLTTLARLSCPPEAVKRTLTVLEVKPFIESEYERVMGVRPPPLNPQLCGGVWKEFDAALTGIGLLPWSTFERAEEWCKLLERLEQPPDHDRGTAVFASIWLASRLLLNGFHDHIRGKAMKAASAPFSASRLGGQLHAQTKRDGELVYQTLLLYERIVGTVRNHTWGELLADDDRRADRILREAAVACLPVQNPTTGRRVRLDGPALFEFLAQRRATVASISRGESTPATMLMHTADARAAADRLLTLPK